MNLKTIVFLVGSLFLVSCGTENPLESAKKIIDQKSKDVKSEFDVQNVKYNGNLTINLSEPIKKLTFSAEAGISVQVHTHNIDALPLDTGKLYDLIDKDNGNKAPYISIGCEVDLSSEYVPCTGTIEFQKLPTSKGDTVEFKLNFKVEGYIEPFTFVFNGKTTP